MPPNKHKPNIILIVLDTHRVDRLGCYGYGKKTSPNIDAYTKRSTAFERAISPAQWTIPSHASLFTGEYPSTHRTIQASDAIGSHFTTLPEYLNRSGYETIGLCNNPLVGVLDNGFRRGFRQFYNYGGTIPSPPPTKVNESKSLNARIRENFRKLVHKISMPIQQTVAASPEVLQFALNPLFVPLWTRYSNFKGDTESSIRDAVHFIKQKFTVNTGPPAFLFLNLMETHLPFTPPKRFIQDFAPIVLEQHDAHDFVSLYNTQALEWLLPLETPRLQDETQALHQMYDAEVAYQDHLLEQLFATLNNPEYADNTLVAIVSDHGEMLGEHQLMGHGIGVYEELVHVPLIIRKPGQTKGVRIHNTVSTINIFHTILEAAGIGEIETPYGENLSIGDKSLIREHTNSEYAFSEAFTPNNLLIILKKYSPTLLDKYHCQSTRWAIYNQPYKLIRTENIRDDIYNYQDDPKETSTLSSTIQKAKKLSTKLDAFLKISTAKGSGFVQTNTGNLDDENVIERLRNLGYIE